MDFLYEVLEMIEMRYWKIRKEKYWYSYHHTIEIKMDVMKLVNNCILWTKEEALNITEFGNIYGRKDDEVLES